MEKFKPVVATRNSDHAHKDYLFAEPAVAVRMIYSNWTRDCLDVMEVTGRLALVDWTTNNADPKAQALNFKELGLRLGATPEAIRLLKGLVPISTKEEKTMAEKLKAKAAGNKAALSEAAKKAPVAAKGAAAPKKNPGNAAALAAARAAKGPDLRKIKVLKKAHGARDGTGRAIMLDKIYGAKTVQEAKDAGVTGSNVSWAAKEGYISLT